MWVDDPHFNAATTSATRRCPRRPARPSSGGWRAACSPAARPLQAAVGDLARRPRRRRPFRDHRQDPPLPRRRHLRRRHRHGALRPRARPAGAAAARPWSRDPSPAARAARRRALERAATRVGLARGAAGACRAPRRRGGGRGRRAGLAAIALAGLGGAPRSPLNGRIGPHRRFAWVDGDLAMFKAIKTRSAARSTTSCSPRSPARCAPITSRRRETRRLELRAMVPVSVRADAERGALGNQVATMYAPLPVGIEDPGARFRAVREAMAGLKESGQAVGAQALTSSPASRRRRCSPRPRACSPAAVLQPRGHQRARAAVPALPARATAVPPLPARAAGRELRLGIAIMTYDGRIGFGLSATTTRCPTSTSSPPPARRDRRARRGRRRRAARRAQGQEAGPRRLSSRSRTKSIASA